MTSGLGSITTRTQNVVSISGVEGVSSLGEIGIIGKSVVIPQGLVITAGIPNVTVWGLVDDSQTPNWSGVDDSQTPNWSEVDDSQTTNWEEKAA
jgi:hypothetical protein